MTTNSAKIYGAFSEADASRLSGLSLIQLRSWDRTDFFKPAFAADNRRQAYSRIYSFRDIVSLRVLGQLRNELGVPLQHLRKVSEKLHAMGDAKWTACTLYVLGKRVVFDDPRSKKRMEVVSGQRVFDLPLRVAISNTKSAIDKLNDRSGEIGHISTNKFILQNQAVFEGTRIPVATIKRYLRAGYTDDDIFAEFPDLSLADIEAARSYGDENDAA